MFGLFRDFKDHLGPLEGLEVFGMVALWQSNRVLKPQVEMSPASIGPLFRISLLGLE